jgi:hypothetical protein
MGHWCPFKVQGLTHRFGCSRRGRCTLNRSTHGCWSQKERTFISAPSPEQDSQILPRRFLTDAKQVMRMMNGVRACDAAPDMKRACVLLPPCSAAVAPVSPLTQQHRHGGTPLNLAAVVDKRTLVAQSLNSVCTFRRRDKIICERIVALTHSTSCPPRHNPHTHSHPPRSCQPITTCVSRSPHLTYRRLMSPACRGASCRPSVAGRTVIVMPVVVRRQIFVT